MCCETCPFSCSPEAEQAQNYACLPSPFEIMQIKAETGKNWSCHHNEDRLCAGFARECRERGIEYRGAESTTYERWYRGSAL